MFPAIGAAFGAGSSPSGSSGVSGSDTFDTGGARFTGSTFNIGPPPGSSVGPLLAVAALAVLALIVIGRR